CSLDNKDITAQVCEIADERGDVYLQGRQGLSSPDTYGDVMTEIDSVMANLTVPFRQVLMLVADGYSYDEIAALTGVKIGTVRSRLHHARKKAQSLLHDAAC